MSKNEQKDETLIQNDPKVNKKCSKNNKNDETVNKNVQENNKKTKKLTAKQQKFVDEYLIDLNATRAYKVAYPNCKSDEAANAASSRLLRNVKVQEQISKGQEEIQDRTKITQDMIVQELAKIAFSNATDYAEIVTRPTIHRVWDKDRQEYVYEEGDVYEQDIILKDTSKLTDDQKAAISCIKNTKHGIAIEQCNKVEALHLLGQHLGMFKNNQPVIVNNNVPNPYKGLTKEELKELIRMKKESDANDKT